MKKFPIKFRLSINILFAGITAVIALLIFFGIKQMIDSGFYSGTLWQQIILLILAAILLTLLISIVFFSKYKITNNHLYICLGIIRTKIDIANIDRINKYDKNKETFIFYTKNGNHKTHMLSVAYEQQKEFINALIYGHPYIIYTEDENAEE